VSVTFDEPNLLSCAGLIPLVRLAERAGLHKAADQRVQLPDSSGSAGANPGAKITSIVAGMAAGGDSIDDLDVIRHGALPRLFGGIRAPSTLGTFLRGSPGETCANSTLWPARRSRGWLPPHRFCPVGTRMRSWTWIPPSTRSTGYAKQGAEYGYTRVRGSHPLLATVSTPIAAPVITATRLRRDSAGSAKGAGSFVAEAITAREPPGRAEH
jgi:hypothetical protein